MGTEDEIHKKWSDLGFYNNLNGDESHLRKLSLALEFTCKLFLSDGDCSNPYLNDRIASTFPVIILQLYRKNRLIELTPEFLTHLLFELSDYTTKYITNEVLYSHKNTSIDIEAELLLIFIEDKLKIIKNG